MNFKLEHRVSYLPLQQKKIMLWKPDIEHRKAISLYLPSIFFLLKREFYVSVLLTQSYGLPNDSISEAVDNDVVIRFNIQWVG